ncbi:MAG: response regulator [Candidatus Obscuribacterales bacterium]|nr:response regulator [Candidatus Obscuribacterales bacterium]
MTQSLKVLLVEDHDADRRLVEEALIDCEIPVELDFVGDGEQAMKYVKQEGQYKVAARPDLIILDLNMPRMDGHQFLDEMHKELRDREIPVVLLTVSDSPQDIGRALNTRMNFFLSKPVNCKKLHQVLSAVSELWAAPTGIGQ